MADENKETDAQCGPAGRALISARNDARRQHDSLEHTYNEAGKEVQKARNVLFHAEQKQAAIAKEMEKQLAASRELAEAYKKATGFDMPSFNRY